MSLESLEERILDLEKLTRNLALEVKNESEGPMYSYCIDILNKIKTPAVVISKDYNLIYMNEAGIKYFKQDLITCGLKIHSKCYKELYNLDNVCEEYIVKKSIENKHVYMYNTKLHNDNKYLIVVIPLIYNGTSGAIQLYVPQ